MAVGVEGDGDAGVTEVLAYDLGVDALLGYQCPQVMNPSGTREGRLCSQGIIPRNS